MLIRSLELVNIRNYQKQSFVFSPKLTIYIGPNTVGKTNIIESLYALSTGKSFRADSDFEMIAWGTTLSRIKAVLDEDQVELLLYEDSVNFGIGAYKKKFLLNGVVKSTLSSIGRFPAVLFSPENIALITGSPGARRKYLDTVLSVSSLEYRKSLSRYEKALRQRNRILAQIKNGEATRELLPYWDLVLIENGSYITKARREYLNYVNSYQIADLNYALKYDSSIISKARLEQYRLEEVQAKATLVGPHRDDFLVEVASGNRSKDKIVFRSLASFGSRGQQRLGVLWLKLAEVEYLEKVFNQKPLLLLDDIFSELDEGHRSLVLRLIANHQTIMTSAEEIDAQLVKRGFPDSSVVFLGLNSK